MIAFVLVLSSACTSLTAVAESPEFNFLGLNTAYVLQSGSDCFTTSYVLDTGVTEEVLSEDEPNLNLEYTPDDMLEINLNAPCNFPEDAYYNFMPECYWDLIPYIIEMDKAGINGAWVCSVIITEVGWECKVSASYNFFNWTGDSTTYAPFDSVEDCMTYTHERFLNKYMNLDWYADRPRIDGQSLDKVTIKLVNSQYALLSRTEINWHWSTVVSQVMAKCYNQTAQLSSV